MINIKTSEQRSKNMAAIKASNTRPEKYVRKLLTAEGFRYRLHSKQLPGNPDIVLSKYNTVMLIHGCFWHRHKCSLGSTPKSNIDFWVKKFHMNLERDQNNIKSLLELGWKVIIVWECAVKGKFRIPENILTLNLSSAIRDSTPKLIEIKGSQI
jgi:DNA mismatch endonuclease (patch repair protein)